MASPMPDPPAQCIIAVLGAPASGKGTACNLAASSPRLSHYGLHHVSVGDLLRGMRDGPDINAYVAAGSVLPGEELVPLLAAHLSGLPIPDSGKKIVLLDGFPRNLEQDDMARNALASGRAKEFPDLVVYFQCPKDVLKGRYVRRRRGTDDGDLFEKRWEQHVREGKSVIERYRERGLLAEVDSSGKVEETSQQFVAVLESFLGQLGQRRD